MLSSGILTEKVLLNDNSEVSVNNTYDSFGNTLKDSSSEYDDNTSCSLYDCESDDSSSTITGKNRLEYFKYPYSNKSFRFGRGQYRFLFKQQ